MVETLDLLKIASESAEVYYEGQPTKEAPSSGSYASKAGLYGLGSGLGAGLAKSLYQRKGLKAGAITTLGTGALWGTLGTLGGSYVKRN